MNPYTKLYKKAAKNLSLSYELLGDNIIFIKYKKKTISFVAGEYGNDLRISNYIAQKKHITKMLLKKHGLPVFSAKVFSKEEISKASNYAMKRIKLPVVIKPLGEMCGIGITSNLGTQKEFADAFSKAAKYSSRILVEKHYDGDDFRVLVCKGKILCITKRTPSFVSGDGKSTLGELIDEKNKKTKYKLSMKDPNVRIAIKRQNISLNKKIPKGKKIRVFNLANIHAGGVPENILLKDVHPDYIKIAKQATKLSGLQLCGVDIMTTDITRPIKQTKAGITELNPWPAIEIHMQSKINPVKDVAEQIIKILLGIK